MRYYFEKENVEKKKYGEIYTCNHPIYRTCTLYRIGGKGLAVIEQRFSARSKYTYWSHVSSYLASAIYINPGFMNYFNKYADEAKNGLYPTVTVRQIMWALRMKPLKKQIWETTFDHCPI
jgi:hypothetical protein